MSSDPVAVDFPLPLIGFAAFSGTGKTTLLLQLLPLLKAEGLRIAVVKHAHHSFEMDHPGKDSYQLRFAGADEMLVAAYNRIGWIRECRESTEEPRLADVLSVLDPTRLDLVLVEGFKSEVFPKIELHRPAMGTPLLCLQDRNIIALAVDEPVLHVDRNLPQLSLNDPQQIAAFIRQFINNNDVVDRAHDVGRSIR